MARIYDLCVSGGLKPPMGFMANEQELHHWERVALDLQKGLKTAEVIVADNVAHYLYEGTDQEDWDCRKDFPCVAPPYESMWIEWKMPRRIVSKVNGVTGVDPDLLGMAVLIGSESFESLYRKRQEMTTPERRSALQANIKKCEFILQQMPSGRQEEFQRLVKSALAQGPEAFEKLHKSLIPSEQFLLSIAVMQRFEERGGDPKELTRPQSNCAWVMQADTFFHFRGRGIVGPVVNCAWEVDSSGAVLNKPLMGLYGTANVDATANLESMTFTALLTLSFMNCKNVVKVSNTPDAPLSKKHEKKTGKPLCRYWTLNIDPMREVLRREGKSDEAGIKKALHICRGHFAVYDERPLFGKYRGRFWKPAHLKGNIKEGVVTKDYEVMSPS